MHIKASTALVGYLLALTGVAMRERRNTSC